jgi:hypothetical protein
MDSVKEEVAFALAVAVGDAGMVLVLSATK